MTRRRAGTTHEASGSGAADGSARGPGGHERHSKHRATPFIALDRSRCEACWECIAVCPESVLGKIDIWFHRHAVIRDGDRCRGCLCCVTACTAGALTARAAMASPHSNEQASRR